jgi:hypothetical protein
MIVKSVIWILGFISFVAFSQSNQILYLDKSPRNLTFGEAAKAIPNAIGTPHLETPTSGLIGEKAAETNFGSSNGEFNVEYDSLQNGSEVRKKNEADWNGKSLNFIYFTPVPALFSPDLNYGLLVTGGIQGNTIDYRKLEGRTESKRSSLSAHGIGQVQTMTFALSFHHQGEVKESSSSMGITNTSSSEESFHLNSFELGIRKDLSTSISVAATYSPKSFKPYGKTNRDSELDPNTNTSRTNIFESKEFTSSNEALSIAGSLKILEDNLILAAGLNRQFPGKVTVDSKENELEGLTSLSLAAEMQLPTESLSILPRFGIHYGKNENITHSSLQSGLALDFGKYIADASLGYTRYIQTLDQTDSFEIKVQFYTYALGVATKL